MTAIVLALLGLLCSIALQRAGYDDHLLVALALLIAMVLFLGAALVVAL